MIDFAISDEQTLVIEMARGFATRELRPHHRAHEEHGVSMAVRGAAQTAGIDELWASVDALGRAGVLEELAVGDAGATLAIAGPALAAAVGARVGASGRAIDAVHVHEGAAPDAIAWLPVRGSTATVLQVERGGAWRLIVVDAAPIAAIGLHAAGGARCSVRDTLAAGGRSEHAAVAIAEVRLAVAAMLVGVARASLEYAAVYVQERVTFGKRLADHQAVAFAIADVAMSVAAARILVQSAALELEARPAGASHAFVEAAQAALFATERGVQLLGGHGYLKDHPVEKWMRDARALALLAGGRDAAAEESECDAWEGSWT